MARRLIRRTLKTLGLLVGVVVLAAAAYVSAAWALGRLAVNADFEPAPPGQGIMIALSSNGAHTNLHLPAVSPVIDWRQVFPPSDMPTPPVPPAIISIGWGDRDFYLNTPTWDDFQFGIGLRAVLGIGPSALQIVYWPPGWRSNDYRSFRISEAAYREIVAYVLATAGVDASGTEAARPIRGHHYLGNDAFYEAVGRYSPILTCNEWVRRGLARAGIRTARWAVLPDPLLDHATELARP